MHGVSVFSTNTNESVVSYEAVFVSSRNKNGCVGEYLVWPQVPQAHEWKKVTNKR